MDDENADIENDAPFIQRKGIPYMPWNASIVMEQLAMIFNMSATGVEKGMIQNPQRLLATTGMDSASRAMIWRMMAYEQNIHPIFR